MNTRQEIHLYIDDSGSRDPNKAPAVRRNDRLDYFAFGGILIQASDVEALVSAHGEFCDKHQIDYPLHSWAIRGGRENFGWLKSPEKAFEFYSDLQEFLLALPVVGIASVIDRPGYVSKSGEMRQTALVPMAKSSFCDLIERAAKYADSRQCALRVFFERSGRNEDRNLIQFVRELKEVGMPFDGTNSEALDSLSADDFRRIVLGEPRGRTKLTPMIQVADLMLYPMAKGGYDPSYRSYAALLKAGKLVDSLLEPKDRPKLGIKYSCFASGY
jgi:Protein of unknown function (DUF3800)